MKKRIVLIIGVLTQRIEQLRIVKEETERKRLPMLKLKMSENAVIHLWSQLLRSIGGKLNTWRKKYDYHSSKMNLYSLIAFINC